MLHTTTTATTTTTTTTATTPLQETLHVRESERVADNSARPDASMTSVDSGVETGNDSNDSIVVTANITSAATAIGQHAANNSVTTITTTSAVNKQHQEQHRCEHQEAGPSFIRIDWPPSVTSEILKFPLPLTALKESYLKTFEYSNECYISSGIPSGLMSPELNQIASVSRDVKRYATFDERLLDGAKIAALSSDPFVAFDTLERLTRYRLE